MQVAVPLNIHSEKNHLKSQAERCFWLLREHADGVVMDKASFNGTEVE